jgi:nitrogen fixation protein NifU and related proteins
LPPMKIHCAELVEGALRAALEGKEVATSSAPSGPLAPTLVDKFAQPQKAGLKIEFLKPQDS